MKKNGVQFKIDSDEETVTKIKMTPETIKVFKRKEFDRPIPAEILNLSDGSAIYTFDCSRFQLDAYFNPFKDSIATANNCSKK